MKKYIEPKTELIVMMPFQMMAGSIDGNTEGDNPGIGGGGGGGNDDDLDFAKKNFFDAEELDKPENLWEQT